MNARNLTALLTAAMFAASCGNGDKVVESREPLVLPLENPRIVINKGQRSLLLYSKGETVRTCRIALGFSPTGHKEREGDGRTPEGDYYICCKNPESKYYLSLGLSYPNEKDAKAGLESGAITQAQHDEIVSAIRGKRIPPWNTPLGGEIFIHGHGAKGQWTHGCIALENEDVRELYEALPIGTPVEIRP
jgi:murein L,D-transpeptidase YafK